jgi:hypothetical protein
MQQGERVLISRRTIVWEFPNPVTISAAAQLPGNPCPDIAQKTPPFEILIRILQATGTRIIMTFDLKANKAKVIAVAAAVIIILGCVLLLSPISHMLSGKQSQATNQSVSPGTQAPMKPAQNGTANVTVKKTKKPKIAGNATANATVTKPVNTSLITTTLPVTP